MRRRFLLLVGALAVAGLPAADVPVPVLAGNVEVVANIPDAAAISATFDPNRPFAYVSTLHGIDIYDLTDPTLPVPVGALPMAFFQNEAISMGAAAVREDGTTFVLVGTDIVGAVTPTSPTQSSPISSNHVYVVDVTDVNLPVLRGDVEASTNAHTVSCVDLTCDYAYTAGTNDDFSIIDLTDLDSPAEVALIPDTWGWHDWDVDAAGIAWQAGDFGTAAFDVTEPLDPKVMNSTDGHGIQGAEIWNQYIHHNTARPFANRFVAGAAPEEANYLDGNVLLITEEDQQAVDCTDEGAFETWHVPTLELGDNPTNTPGEGTIAPLDYWQTELYDTGDRDTYGIQCSAHYFDWHQAGFVAQAWYDQGVRILDVRDPLDIKQVGYWVTQTQLAWAAYFIPERNDDGTVVVDEWGETVKSDLVLVTDAARGIDILRVALPTSAPSSTIPVVAPILPSWLEASVSIPHPAFGYVCRLA